MGNDDIDDAVNDIETMTNELFQLMSNMMEGMERLVCVKLNDTKLARLCILTYMTRVMHRHLRDISDSVEVIDDKHIEVAKKFRDSIDGLDFIYNVIVGAYTTGFKKSGIAGEPLTDAGAKEGD